MTTAELMARMKVRFCLPEWVLLTEVRNYQDHRRADAIAFNRYSSKKFEIWGFEVKVSRADLMRELRDPTKWEVFGVYCDRFWLVVSEKEIINGVSLPPAWGVFVSYGQTLRQVRPASRLDSKLISRGMMSEIVYNLFSESPSQQAVHTSYEKGKLDGIEQRNAQMFNENYNTLQKLKQVEEFEKASGIQIDQWNGRRIGEELNRFIAVNYALERYERDLRDCQERAQKTAEYLKRVMDKQAEKDQVDE